MLLLQKLYKANALLCRDHAIPVVKEYLGKTLVQGWWGVISFFVNFVVVGQDAQRPPPVAGLVVDHRQVRGWTPWA